MTRKGVYPYDYVTSIEKLKETKLPPKEAFYSKLLNEEIADEDYQHAHNVWNTFNCGTIQDYHDLYLKSDVLLLADVFENFSNTHPDQRSKIKNQGCRFCNKCFHSIGRVFIIYTSKDRCHFQKKSVYKRSYHFQNKLDEIRQKYDLVYKPEVYIKLKSDLEKIDKAINTINIQYERKRLINISYLIKRILSEYDTHEADKIELKISNKTLNFYDNWYETYQAMQ